MKFSFRMMPIVGALALAGTTVPLAHAGCGQYRPASFNTGAGSPFTAPRLLPVSLAGQEDLSSGVFTMVGTWKEHWISEGSKGIPDGTEVDAGYAQWHSDNTEINVSGLRSPLTGNVCFGEWQRTGERTYRMNHFGISYDPTGQKLVGVAHIQQWLTLEDRGQATSGRFTIDQYDEAGDLLAHLQGRIIGTRVTMDTGFEKVE